MNNVLGIWGLKDGYKEDADHNLTHWLNTSEGLEAVKYYNRFYLEGLMDPDSFLNKFDDWKLKFSNDRYRAYRSLVAVLERRPRSMEDDEAELDRRQALCPNRVESAGRGKVVHVPEGYDRLELHRHYG